MAQLLETLRNQGQTSVYGRRLGLDQYECMIGPKAFRVPIRDIQSTTPNTAVENYGIINVLTSGSSQGPTQHTLSAPIPGVAVQIVMNTTSTGSQQFAAPSGVSILAASDGTTKATVNMLGQGGVATLMGLSTSRYADVTPRSTGVINVSYTTST